MELEVNREEKKKRKTFSLTINNKLDLLEEGTLSKYCSSNELKKRS